MVHLEEFLENKDFENMGLHKLDNTFNLTKLCSGPASPVHIFNVWIIIMQSSNI